MKIALVAVAFVLSALSFAGVSRAEVKVEAVEYKDGETVLQGYMAYDDAVTTPRPGVLICHEWWGCDEYTKSRAQQLAKLGYVAFALDMYGKGVIAEDAKKAGELSAAMSKDVEKLRVRAMKGYDILAKSPRVDPAKIAVIGYCMGGGVALELARTGSRLKAIVCFHTSSLAAKNAKDNLNITGPVLVCQGAIDTFVSPEQKEKFHKQMDEAKIDYQYVEYAGALHAFTNPQAGSHNLKGVEYNEKADKRSWALMQSFFKETLGS